MMRHLMLVFTALATTAMASCPFGGVGALPEGHPGVVREAEYPNPPAGFEDALKAIDFDEVKADIRTMFKQSQDFWPADYGNYAPFFVRLAWHNTGSYRTSDGRGGADGGRQRFEPERSWADNTNLDKARHLLLPIKLKYGLGLSWGDLIVLTGNTAIESMGGPVLGFCAGRIDDQDGTASLPLGPSSEQEAIAPCALNGTCETPLGSTTVGLIYLNPEGPLGKPVPEISAGQVRDTFGRMAMNDTETVSLIGGGHAFGKTHGACPAGAGPSPKVQPLNPWPGLCGSGRGADAVTSGFEGPWTTRPTTWDNQYFKNLVSFDWAPAKGPGGHFQWHASNDAKHALVAPGPQGGKQNVMMLTSDVSLTKDPTGAYQKIVKRFAESQEAFDTAFAHAWYKLTTRDMGPVTRCLGDDVPPPQPWQHALPPAPKVLPDFASVSSALDKALDKAESESATVLSTLVRLAYRCAATFRVTDYLGGCNGARIRFSPEKDWPVNAGLGDALDKILAPIQAKFGDSLSMADLIVLAGNTAVARATKRLPAYSGAGKTTLPFCPGRSDARDGGASAYLAPRMTGARTDTATVLKDTIKVSGRTFREYVALRAGTARAAFQDFGKAGVANNGYLTALLTERYELVEGHKDGPAVYKATGRHPALYMRQEDMLIKTDPELSAVALELAADTALLQAEFSSAWTRLMSADRFDGPTGNVCATAQHAGVQQASPTRAAAPSRDAPAYVFLGAGAVAIGAVAAAVLAIVKCRQGKAAQAQAEAQFRYAAMEAPTAADAIAFEKL